jgi:hypothetical protein
MSLDCGGVVNVNEPSSVGSAMGIVIIMVSLASRALDFISNAFVV